MDSEELVFLECSVLVGRLIRIFVYILGGGLVGGFLIVGFCTELIFFYYSV